MSDMGFAQEEYAANGQSASQNKRRRQFNNIAPHKWARMLAQNGTLIRSYSSPQPALSKPS